MKRKAVATTLLVALALVNLMDLATTVRNLESGALEGYLPSAVIMSAIGLVGFAVVKAGASAFIVVLAWPLRNRWERVSRFQFWVACISIFVALWLLGVVVINNLLIASVLHSGLS